MKIKWTKGTRTLLIQTHAHSAIVQATSGFSSEIRHRNQLTAKAWEKAVQELSNTVCTV